MRPSGRLRRRAIRLIAGLLVIIVCAAIALAVWAKTGVMEAEPRPLQAVLSEPGVSVVEDADAMVLRPDAEADSRRGLVFYPDAKVEAGAYAARMIEISGASHSSFGDYGPQSGNRSPSIDDEQMDAAVTEELTEFAQHHRRVGSARAVSNGS